MPVSSVSEIDVSNKEVDYVSSKCPAGQAAAEQVIKYDLETTRP